MSGTALLLDTDVLVDSLRGARRLVAGDIALAYSVVTLCELFAGTDTDEGVVRVLLSPFTPIDVDVEIAERAGRIRRVTRLRTPDALIAATAVVHGLALVTRNLRDFGRVTGLSLRDPESLRRDLSP
jgi:predicted nucleic acid-binding protein